MRKRKRERKVKWYYSGRNILYLYDIAYYTLHITQLLKIQEHCDILIVFLSFSELFRREFNLSSWRNLQNWLQNAMHLRGEMAFQHYDNRTMNYYMEFHIWHGMRNRRRDQFICPTLTMRIVSRVHLTVSNIFESPLFRTKSKEYTKLTCYGIHLGINEISKWNFCFQLLSYNYGAHVFQITN